METKRDEPTQNTPPGTAQQAWSQTAAPDSAAPLHPVPYDLESEDAAITDYLLDCYTQQDGFHCPICKVIIDDPTQAVHHMAGELNAAWLKLSQEAK